MRVAMDFDIGDEQEELRTSVRAVLERECPIAVVRDLVEKGTVPEQPWRSATELGWPAIAVPERFGGLGLGFVELALVVEEHGRFLAPGPFLATVTQFAPAVREAGTDEQQARFLGGVAAGQLTGALAVSSPAGRCFPPDDSLRARRRGAGWELTGTRHHVIDGDVADEVVVSARVEEGDGVALFVVPRLSLKSARVTSLDASRPIAAIELDGVGVGADRVLGEPGACGPALTRALEEATIALALETVGVCQELFDRTLEYAKHREQFGRPIGSFQAIQHRFADMFADIEKARATGYFAAMAVAEDDPRRALAASMAKVAAGDCQRRVAREGIQIHGGIGFTWEHDVHLFVKRAKTGEALFGTSAVHRARIADLLQI
jgi:alkylation response protein AidB-like acyl-CoA dehydrogenase